MSIKNENLDKYDYFVFRYVQAKGDCPRGTFNYLSDIEVEHLEECIKGEMLATLREEQGLDLEEAKVVLALTYQRPEMLARFAQPTSERDSPHASSRTPDAKTIKLAIAKLLYSPL